MLYMQFEEFACATGQNRGGGVEVNHECNMSTMTLHGPCRSIQDVKNSDDISRHSYYYRVNWKNDRRMLGDLFVPS